MLPMFEGSTNSGLARCPQVTWIARKDNGTGTGAVKDGKSVDLQSAKIQERVIGSMLERLR